MATLCSVTDAPNECGSQKFPVEERGPVLKAYLQRAPGARPHIPVDHNAPLEEFEPVAAQIPVFRILAAAD
jgi:hypothetical protein